MNLLKITSRCLHRRRNLQTVYVAWFRLSLDQKFSLSVENRTDHPQSADFPLMNDRLTPIRLLSKITLNIKTYDREEPARLMTNMWRVTRVGPPFKFLERMLGNVHSYLG